MSFTNAELALRINEGAADAQLTRLSLYGGAGMARLIADARNATPRIALDLDLQNVNALPLLTDAIGFDKLEGRGRLRAQIAAQGASQAAIMRALAGSASFNFNDGAIKGVNLAQVARSRTIAHRSANRRSRRAQTDFAELAASFVLANGAAATEDLRLLNPFIRLDGQGIINAGEQTIDMRIAPRAVRSIEGQGGDASVAGLGIPFRITGPWARVNFRPAVEEVVTNVVRDQAQRALQHRPHQPTRHAWRSLEDREALNMPALDPGGFSARSRSLVTTCSPSGHHSNDDECLSPRPDLRGRTARRPMSAARRR